MKLFILCVFFYLILNIEGASQVNFTLSFEDIYPHRDVVENRHLIDKETALMLKRKSAYKPLFKEDTLGRKTKARYIEFDLQDLLLPLIEDEIILIDSSDLNSLKEYIMRAYFYRLDNKDSSYEIESHYCKTVDKHVAYAKKMNDNNMEEKCKSYKFQNHVSTVIEFLKREDRNQIPKSIDFEFDNLPNENQYYFNFGRLCPPLCNE